MSWRRVGPDRIQNAEGEQVHQLVRRDTGEVQYRAVRGEETAADGPSYVGPWRDSRQEAHEDLAFKRYLGWRRVNHYRWERPDGASMVVVPQQAGKWSGAYWPDWPVVVMPEDLPSAGLEFGVLPYLATSADGRMRCVCDSFAGASHALDDITRGVPNERGVCWCPVPDRQQGESAADGNERLQGAQPAP